MPPTRSRRLSVAAAAAAIALAVAAAALLVATGDGGGGSEATLRAGTPLEPQPAPAIALTDQDGQPRSLADLRGRVVVVTFLFTTCPDVCPLTADKLAAADERLGADAERVAYLAVSLDPAGDTAEARREFLAAHGLPGDRSFFVSGEPAAVEAVWAAYGIGRQEVAERVDGTGDGHGHTHGDVQHTDVSFLVDAEGRERVVVRSDVAVPDLVADLEALLAEA